MRIGPECDGRRRVAGSATHDPDGLASSQECSEVAMSESMEGQRRQSCVLDDQAEDASDGGWHERRAVLMSEHQAGVDPCRSPGGRPSTCRVLCLRRVHTVAGSMAIERREARVCGIRQAGSVIPR